MAYGVRETNSIEESGLGDFDWEYRVDWTEPGLKVVRLRLISDPGYPMWDVSYCWGVLPDGTKVRVNLPFTQVPKGRVSAFLIEEARRAGVYAKGIGLLDHISTLN